MGHRLSKIYTRTGDAGTTGLGDGERASKTAERVHAMGDVDELNSLIGVLVSDRVDAEIYSCLLAVQHDLFDLGGEISIPGSTLLPESAINRLEVAIDRWNDTLPPLQQRRVHLGQSRRRSSSTRSGAPRSVVPDRPNLHHRNLRI